MLSSIHPLGERARGNRWWVTVTALTLGSAAGGAAVGGTLGWLGSGLDRRDDLVLLVIGALALLAAGLDLAGVPAAGPERQVNERWIGAYRGWVYGAGFGAQLGVGLATYVVTWAVWALFVTELLSGSAMAGAAIGTAFGLGRALGPVAAGHIDRPSRLTTFHERMADLAKPSHLGAGVATAVLGVVALLVGA